MGYYNYILSGLGKLEGVIYQNTTKLYDILFENNVISKIMKIPQLGAITYNMPGAKHTRYEYVILQFDLINKLKNYKGNEYNGTSNKCYKKIRINAPFNLPEEGSLSLGDMFQMLALINNIGYTKNTFIDSRVLIRVLKENKELRKKYKYAVGREFKEYFEQYLKEENCWKFHYLNSVIILRSLVTEENQETINLALNIIYKYLDYSKYDEIADDIRIFKNIRMLAFVIIDLNFSPLPLNFNSNNLPSLLEKIVSKHTDPLNTNQFVNDISDLLEKNIYLDPHNLLCMSCLENLSYSKFKKEDIAQKNIIRKLLSENSFFFGDYKVRNIWDKKILKIDIPLEKNYDEIKVHLKKLEALSGIVTYYFEHRNLMKLRVCISIRKDYSGNKWIRYVYSIPPKKQKF